MEGDETVLRRPKPRRAEDLQVEQRRAELAALAANLADGELEVVTLKVELVLFERHHQSVVARRCAEMDELVAKTAEEAAARQPSDPALRERARAARSRAAEAAAGLAGDVGAPYRAFAPSPELQSLFRDAVKAVHPDLAADDEDRQRRQPFMAEAVKAYAAGDAARLRAILARWQASADSVSGEGPDVEVIKAVRRIAQARRRLDELSKELTALMTSDLGMRFSRAQRA